MNYSEAKEIMAKARDKSKGAPLGNNTRLFEHAVSTSDVYYSVRLHNTDVVNIYKNGCYSLNSGGWRTRTTQDRINTYSPIRVYADKGTWHIGAIVFVDGIVINSKLLGDK